LEGLERIVCSSPLDRPSGAIVPPSSPQNTGLRRLTPIVPMTLEQAIAYIEDDELVHKLDAARCLARLPQRFFATVELDPDRAGRDAGRIAAGLAAPNGPAKEQSAGDR